MISLLFYLVILAILYYFIRWFFDPYFRYRNRRKVKEYLLYENGKQLDTREPYLISSNSFDVDLSIIVPAYNEDARLPTMMKDTLEYLDKKIKDGKLLKKVEMVIVSDGSKDKTAEIIKDYTSKHTTDKDISVRGIILIQNQGKGAAVKYGCLYAKGKYVLFADADGATDINSFDNVFNECKKLEKNGLSCCIGSRYEETSHTQRKFLRRIISATFNTLVQFVLRNNIRDTQCGFKIFSRDAAKLLFPTQHLERWAFDIELLLLCGQKRIPVKEVAVDWQEIDGSHLNVVDATIQMARDMILIKFLYTFRLWGWDDFSY